MTEKRNKKAAFVGAVVILALVICFLATHTFIDGTCYAKNTQMLDLQGKVISAEHYDAIREAFPEIEILWDVPFQEGKLANTLPELEITRLTDEDVQMLKYFPYLKTVDARHCTDYPQIEALTQQYPDVEILYNVTIDGQVYSQDAVYMKLEELTPEALKLLQYLPELTYVDAAGCEEYDLLMQLRTEYPQIQLYYHVSISGKNYSQDTKNLSLTDVETEELLKILGYLPELESVTVMDPRYSDVSMVDVAEKYTDIAFYWEMDVFGVRATSEDTEIDLDKMTLESVEAVELALANFPDLERAYLGRCGLDNEELAAYRDRVRSEYKVVWNIMVGYVSVDTDDTWFMPGKFGKGLVEEQAQLLKYCEDMVCIDVGHKGLTTCEFVRYMPNLKYLILACTAIEDLTPLETCKNLVFLEIFFTHAGDYTPLLGCTSLEELNLSFTWGDPEPIMQMTWLKRLWWLGREKLTAEFEAALPDTYIVLFSHHDAVAYGWRQGQRYYEQRDYMGVPYMW